MTAEPAPGAESWLARLREVRETGDRRATGALVALLLDGDLDDDLLEEVADTLCVLEDPRCERRLEAALVDASRRRTLRGAALRVLSCLPTDDPPPVRVAAWLDDSDGLVRAHAASFLGPRDEARIAALAHDPVVEVRRAAAEALVGAVRTPRLVDTLHAALRDPDPLVREIACRAALFDEPVAVTYDLLHLLDDADGDVRCGAYDALEDYPCVSVLLALADARSGPDGALAAATLELLVSRVAVALAGAPGTGVRRILRWATPARWILEEQWEGHRAVDAPAPPGDVADALADPVDDLDGDLDGAPGDDTDDECERADRPAVDLRDAERVLVDPDAPGTRQRDVLVSRDWGATGERGLGVLVAAASSRLWSLRHGVVVALLDLARCGVHGAADALLRLAGDVEPIVRRVALHALTHAGDRRAVEPALATLADDGARPMAGDAALATVAHLAPSGVAEQAILDELRRGDDRDGVRLGAVHLAERLRVGAAVPHLAALVSSAVVAGPSVHLAALRALRELDERPRGVSLAHLEGLDHLDVQAELAAWDWHGPRYG